jgi:excisionase family DNA binding protein
MATQLLRIGEVAAQLGLKPSTVRKMLARGELLKIRPTKRAVRVREEDVEALILRGIDARHAALPAEPASSARRLRKAHGLLFGAQARRPGGS